MSRPLNLINYTSNPRLTAQRSLITILSLTVKKAHSSSAGFNQVHMEPQADGTAESAYYPELDRKKGS
jgi:hypothetical protein